MKRIPTPAERVEDRLNEARMRAEYFAKGGEIWRYPQGYHGPKNRLLQTHWGRKQLQQAAQKRAK